MLKTQPLRGKAFQIKFNESTQSLSEGQTPSQVAWPQGIQKQLDNQQVQTAVFDLIKDHLYF